MKNKEKTEIFNKGMSYGIYLARKQLIIELQIQVDIYQKENNYFENERKE